MGTEFAEDCIHLHACRRMAKIYRESKSFKSYFIKRECNEECTAYQKAKRRLVVTFDDAYDAAKEGIRMSELGYGVGDAIAPQDFETFYAYEIVNGENCEDKEW